MELTFENVFENREYFQELCKEANACEEQYKRLLRARTKEEFMNVIYDNFRWINFKIKEFRPKFDWVGYFYEGIARVRLNDKRGYIKQDGSYLVEPRFDWVDYFCEGFARVELNGKYGFIRKDGTYLVEPKFDWVGDFSEGVAHVRLDDKWGTVDIKGEIKWNT